MVEDTTRQMERLPAGCIAWVEHFAALADAVASKRKLEDVLKAFSEHLPMLLPFDRSSISVITDGKRITWHLERGGKIEHIGATAAIKAGSLVDLTMQQRRLIIVHDLGETPPHFQEEHELLSMGSHSLVSSPLLLEGNVIGSMNIESDQTGAYTERDEPILRVIASQVAIALDRSDIFGRQEKRIEDVGAQLVRAGQMATVGQLAAVISHEIKNAFNAIQLRAQLMRRRIDRGETPDVEPFLTAIARSVDQGVRLMQDLLHYAKPAPPRRQRFPLNTLLREALGMTHRANVRIEWDLASDLPDAWADSAQIGQVFINLVLNALEAMPKGGTCRVSAHRIDECLEVQVSDTGVGISEDHLGRIFEPFFTTKKNGTGLGMSISRSIVEANGGSIHVASRVGQGTTFSVRLPAAEECRKAA